MGKVIVNRHCGNCENGICSSVTTRSKSGVINITFKECNICNKLYGLNNAGSLKVVNNKDIYKTE